MESEHDINKYWLYVV